MNPQVAFPPTAADPTPGIDQAVQETLELLEWPRVCDHLASFASTGMGRDAARSLVLPETLETSRQRLAETVEMAVLDDLIEGGISFRGVQDLTPVLLRCSKGGVASGEELLAVAETLAAARRLRRQIDEPELRPACSALIDTMVTLPELEQRLKFALEEGGRIADRASAPLAGLRQQWQGLRQERRDKLQDLLRRLAPFLQDSVIAQRHGRPVLAVKAGAVAQVAGQVHDSSASGSTVFVEPRSVLTIGNRLTDLEGRIREEERKVLRRSAPPWQTNTLCSSSWCRSCCSWIWPWPEAVTVASSAAPPRAWRLPRRRRSASKPCGIRCWSGSTSVPVGRRWCRFRLRCLRTCGWWRSRDPTPAERR